MSFLKGVLLHGGRGTRLRPLTHTGPKQLLKVGGKPISQWCLEDLRDASVREVAVILGDLAPERTVEYYGDGRWLGLDLHYIYQGRALGIAQAVYLARDFVGDDAFVVYLGDNLLRHGVSRYLKDFESSDAEAMVLLCEVKEPQRFGVAEFDEEGRLKRLVEKPRQPPSPYALVGVYFFRSAKVFKAIEELTPSWRGEFEITDSIQRLLDWGLKVDYRIITGWWKDTGTPEDILEANRMILDEKLSSEVRGVVEDGAILEGRVYVDEGAVVKAGARVRGPSYIGRGSIIESETYVGPFTSIGDHCLLSNVEIEDSVLMDYVTLANLRERLTGSLLGSYVEVIGGLARPRGTRLVVGERTKVILT